MGSNTIRMLVGRAKAGRVEQALDRSEFVRLGAGVDESGKLQPEREQAAIEAISNLVRQANELGAKKIQGIATSAVRDAANGQAFGERVRKETGVDLEIISGDREAKLTFLGATSGLESQGAKLVCDLGGGSAELICANQSALEWSVSLPLGSGRLTERFVHHDPPERQEVDEVRMFVSAQIATLTCTEVPDVVLTGGTATHLAFLAGSTETMTEVDLNKGRSVLKSLLSMPSSEIAAKHGIGEERAKVLPAGTTAIITICEHFSAKRMVVTRQGIREGVLLEEEGDAECL